MPNHIALDILIIIILLDCSHDIIMKGNLGVILEDWDELPRLIKEKFLIGDGLVLSVWILKLYLR